MASILTLFAWFAVSASALLDSNNISHLAIRLLCADKNRVPKSLTVSIANLGQAPLRLPVPTITCTDSYRGSVDLAVRLLRRFGAPPATGMGKGCGGGLYDAPRGQQRLKEWMTLKKHQSLELKLPTDIGYNFREPGEYVYSAVYNPPELNISEKRLLLDNHERFSEGQTTSNSCLVTIW